MTKKMTTLVAEPLTMEWLRGGTWISSSKHLPSPALREQALKALEESPDRYFYPAAFGMRIRISYREN